MPKKVSGIITVNKKRAKANWWTGLRYIRRWELDWLGRTKNPGIKTCRKQRKNLFDVTRIRKIQTASINNYMRNLKESLHGMGEKGNMSNMFKLTYVSKKPAKKLEEAKWDIQSLKTTEARKMSLG